MSGVEAVGLALAVLPLMISAADHYERCLRPFVRYRNFTKEVDFFCWSFSVQKQIFKNQCLILLEEIIEHDAASIVLSGAGQPSLTDGKLEEKLDALLGESKESCVATIERIRTKLSDIELEIKELGTAIDQERQKSKISIRNKDWVARAGKKLLFSFKQSSRLEQSLTLLQTLNTAFTMSSDQSIRLMPSRRSAIKAHQKASLQEIERYQTIGRAACQAYEALGKACTRHTEHQAHFCVESVQAAVDFHKSLQIRFNLAFGNLNPASCVDQGDLVWFVVNSIIGDSTNKNRNYLVLELNKGATQSPEQRNNNVSVTSGKEREKRVRFQLSPPASPTNLAAVSIADSIASNANAVEDLCEYLRRSCLQSVEKIACVGLVEKTGSCKTFIYPSSPEFCSQRRHATTLRQLISSMSKQSAAGQTFIHERVRLAKTLAIAVLQYHATPWLGIPWKSEELYFFGPENMSSLEAWRLTSSPHLNLKVRGANGQELNDSTGPLPKLARNSLLFSLAVVFLEIAHSSNLGALQQPIDLINGQETNTEFFVARRLSRSDHTDLGPRYHSIIERLVECDFGCGDDLSNLQLQSAILREVICPLEALEQKLRALYHYP